MTTPLAPPAPTIFETILYEVSDGVATVTLNRPDAANTINVAMGRDLKDVAIACDEDTSVRAVLLRANGKLFCAGGDLPSFAAFGNEIGAQMKRLTTDMHAALSRFIRMRAPLVVAVQGAAAGAGLPLAMAGDLVLAGRSASFTMGYTAVGLSPDGGSTYLLPRLIGMRRAQELTLLNRRLSAQEAYEWQLLTQIIDDDALAHEALAVARRLAAGPTAAFASAKRLLWGSLGDTMEVQMELKTREIAANAGGPDGTEGIAAFAGKRKPVYTGRL
jgi:2-(1,2-epoxy-1,2-dihydrophenyl)acetyl-CoA isomerase